MQHHSRSIQNQSLNKRLWQILGILPLSFCWLLLLLFVPHVLICFAGVKSKLCCFYPHGLTSELPLFLHWHNVQSGDTYISGSNIYIYLRLKSDAIFFVSADFFHGYPKNFHLEPLRFTVPAWVTCAPQERLLPQQPKAFFFRRTAARVGWKAVKVVISTVGMQGLSGLSCVEKWRVVMIFYTTDCQSNN